MRGPLSPADVLSAAVHRLHARLTTLLIFIVSLGPLPRHVGFVMDGNRRFARGRGQKAAWGHSEGFNSLRRTLDICLRLRIRAVTIYAFAIDNFSRSAEEVDALMELGKSRLEELCRHGDLLQRHGVRIRFVGAREMLRQDVREAYERMEEMTKGYTGGVLNVCAPYSSRDEATQAVRRTMQEVDRGELRPSEISSETVFSNLETSRNVAALGDPASLQGGKLDILVRTSGVHRLSDFMMWQASEDTQLHFVKTSWPEFGFSDLLPVLLGWQQKVWLRRLGV